jgi:3-hydroxyacyl-[acyl-carrier-protein] dehydratase
MDTSLMERAPGKELGTIDISKILECLPHRYPFLMIDRIVRIDGDESAVGIKNVTFNEPIFQGHFPGKPIFPGVLIIEGMAQTAGAIVIAHDADKGGKSIVLMLTIDKAKFRKPAEPGDQIEFHIKKIQRRRNVGRYEAKAMVDGVVIAEAEIGAMIVGE